MKNLQLQKECLIHQLKLIHRFLKVQPHNIIIMDHTKYISANLVDELWTEINQIYQDYQQLNQHQVWKGLYTLFDQSIIANKFFKWKSMSLQSKYYNELYSVENDMISVLKHVSIRVLMSYQNQYQIAAVLNNQIIDTLTFDHYISTLLQIQATILKVLKHLKFQSKKIKHEK